MAQMHDPPGLPQAVGRKDLLSHDRLTPQVKPRTIKPHRVPEMDRYVLGTHNHDDCRVKRPR